MKKKSLQQIEDFYIKLGYTGESRRKALLKDKEYQNILRERGQKLTKHFKISRAEKRRYMLSTDADFEILAKCKQLEKLRLKKEDGYLVKFIKSQLEREWRKPVLKILGQILKKYTQKTTFK